MPSINSYCIGCILRKQEERIRSFTDEVKKAGYMQAVCRMIGNAKMTDTAPVLASRCDVLLKEYLQVEEDYSEKKKEYNELMLKYEADIRKKIKESADSLKEALKYARVGNYIDFGAVKNVEKNQLDFLLEKVQEDSHVDEREYENMKADLQKAKTLVYLTDNCGEILLDKLFIQEIQARYPSVEVTVIVRGEQTINDATMEDAIAVGMDKTAEVLGNGVGIPGTPLDYIGEEAKAKIMASDVIISKGQGNFESLNGCGCNVYYLFLCKCEWFVHNFKLKQFEGVLLNEKNISERLQNNLR